LRARWPAPDAPLCDAPARCLDCAVPDDSTQVAHCSKASRRRSSDPRSDALGSQCSFDASRITLAMRHRQALPVVRSRQVGAANIARADRVCLGPGAVRSPGVEASSGIDCGREPQRSAIASQLASPARCPMVFRARHDLQPFPSLYRGRAEGRGLEPPLVHRVGTKPPSRWGNAARSAAPALQSKPITQASRLVAQVAPSVAFGFGVRILAAGPARARLYS
jgi:hypothetical protein